MIGFHRLPKIETAYKHRLCITNFAGFPFVFTKKSHSVWRLATSASHFHNSKFALSLAAFTHSQGMSILVVDSQHASITTIIVTSKLYLTLKDCYRLVHNCRKIVAWKLWSIFIHWSLRGTYRDRRASRLSHLRTFSSHLTVIIGENLLVILIFISSQLATWFCHYSEKSSMCPSCTES